jgi:hypothetical protein
MSETAGEQVNFDAETLRSIAKSIRPSFPDAADRLVGIAWAHEHERAQTPGQVFTVSAGDFGREMARMAAERDAARGEVTALRSTAWSWGNHVRDDACSERCPWCAVQRCRDEIERVPAMGQMARDGLWDARAILAAARPALSREALRKRLDGHWPVFEPRHNTWKCECGGWVESHQSGERTDDQMRDHLADVLDGGRS